MDPTVLASSGKGHLRVWKLYEVNTNIIWWHLIPSFLAQDTLTELANYAFDEFTSTIFTDHCWYDEEHLAVTTDTGDLLVSALITIVFVVAFLRLRIEHFLCVCKVFAEQQLLMSFQSLQQDPSLNPVLCPCAPLIGVHTNGQGGLIVAGPRKLTTIEPVDQVGLI